MAGEQESISRDKHLALPAGGSSLGLDDIGFGYYKYKYYIQYWARILSHNWNTAIERYKLFRRDSQGRRHRGVALYVKKLIDCEELLLRNSHGQIESLWVKVKDWPNKGCLVVGVYYKPPDQGPKACWWGLTASAVGSIMLACFLPDGGGLQPPGCLLGK